MCNLRVPLFLKFYRFFCCIIIFLIIVIVIVIVTVVSIIIMLTVDAALSKTFLFYSFTHTYSIMHNAYEYITHMHNTSINHINARSIQHDH